MTHDTTSNGDQLLDTARAAMKNGDWQNAFNMLISAELVSAAPALNDLGWLYLSGNGTTKQIEKVVGCLQESVSQGHGASIHNLALLYQYGVGVEMNEAKATELFREAARLGIESAEEKLRMMKMSSENSAFDETINQVLSQRKSSEVRKPIKGWELAQVEVKKHWAYYLLVAAVQTLCLILLNAFLICQVYPLLPGFHFQGIMLDALKLGFIFWFVSILVWVPSMIALPIVVLPFVLVFAALVVGLFSKDEGKFKKMTAKVMQLTAKMNQSGRFAALKYAPISLVLNAVSLRILSDCFPNLFMLKTGIATLVVALELTIAQSLVQSILNGDFEDQSVQAQSAVINLWLLD